MILHIKNKTRTKEKEQKSSVKKKNRVVGNKL